MAMAVKLAICKLSKFQISSDFLMSYDDSHHWQSAQAHEAALSSQINQKRAAAS